MQRCYRSFTGYGLCILLVLLVLSGYGCGDQNVTVKQFECEKDTECQNSHTCQNGKCVLDDQDKDGWARNRGGTANNKDCNDNNKDVHPGAPEICDNQADDNCDGRIDEQPCQCQNGLVRECGEDKGICKKGQQTCNAGVWGPCQGGVDPKPEECNGLDDDCDGHIDEDVPGCCQPQETRPCGSAQGECKQGVQKCNAGKWTECEGAVGPKAEECNGKDDDCDGQVDNIKDSTKPIEQPCYGGPAETQKKGACKDGFQICKDGKWEPCQKDVQPEEEICDDKDNDCDGQIDNVKGGDKVLQRECYSGDAKTKGIGICKSGVQSCVGGRWSTCIGEVTAISESCNGIDDDCDGNLDNNPGETKPLNQPCYTGPTGTRQKGICADGLQECVNGRWGSCKNDKLPEVEDCNGLDDDCDGRVDNIQGKTDPLVGACYTGPQGTQGKGECKEGSRFCQNGKWSACQGDTFPTTEVCNGKDDDCNGQIDDKLSNSSPCQTNKKGECLAGITQCVNGSSTCVSINQPANEVCNGKDDDCNGLVDDGNPGGGGNCNYSGKPGLCSEGKLECRNGKVECIQVVFPANEACNGKDDNCNGTIDDNAPCSRGYACSGGTCQVCSQPQSRCSNYDLFCTGDAPSISCNCGFTSYCYQQSSSIFCNGCCAERRCH